MFDKIVGQTLIKKAPLWAFVMGLGLVGMALVFIASTPSDTHSAPSVQRVRVMQAAADLQPCLTCHTSFAGVIQATIDPAAGAAVAHSTDFVPFSVPHTDPIVHDQLAVLSQRILSVSSSESREMAVAEREFLRIYGQVQTEKSGSVTLAELSTLAELITLVEHQASPVRLGCARPSCEGRCKLALVRGLTTGPDHDPVAAGERITASQVVIAARWQNDPAVIVVPTESVFGIHRRGPPAMGQVYLV